MAEVTSMSVLLIVGPKCTLAASHATLGESREYADGQTDGRTDARPLHNTFRQTRRNNDIPELEYGSDIISAG